MLIEGPQGWGEFSPPHDVDDHRAVRWLTAAIEVGTVGWPDPVRGRVPIAVLVPAVDPESARRLVIESGCDTAAVDVGGHPGSLADDIARVEAVRDALGAGGAIRCDARGGWSVEEAAAAVPALDRAAGGVEFVEQPCSTLDEIAELRRRIDVPIAVDESVRDAKDLMSLDLAGAADIAVLTVGALGGVRRALRVAETCGLPCVAAADLGSSIGIAGGAALAGVLPAIGYASSLGAAALLAGDVVSDGRAMIPVDGYVPVAPMPPCPDTDRLQKYAPADPDTVRWWRARLAAVQHYL